MAIFEIIRNTTLGVAIIWVATIILYLSAKAVTFGYLQARKQFFKQQKEADEQSATTAGTTTINGTTDGRKAS